MKKVIKKYKSWNKIPWGLIQTDIFNLQYKIFKHAKRNDLGNNGFTLIVTIKYPVSLFFRNCF